MKYGHPSRPGAGLRAVKLTALLTLLAIGCHGEDPVIPSAPDPGAWAGYIGDGGATLADGYLGDPPPEELCSETNGPATTLRVVNSTRTPVILYWVDFECVERQYQIIPPGEFRDQPTFVEHVWRLRTDQGDWLEQVRLSETPTEVIELQ